MAKFSAAVLNSSKLEKLFKKLNEGCATFKFEDNNKNNLLFEGNVKSDWFRDTAKSISSCIKITVVCGDLEEVFLIFETLP